MTTDKESDPSDSPVELEESSGSDTDHDAGGVESTVPLDQDAGPRCAECNASNAPNARFCGRCGQRLMQQATTMLGSPAESEETEETHVGNDTTRSELNLSATPARYRIIEHIGSGGMGTVYLAKDEHLDRFVALKLLGKALVDSAEMKERLFREAKSIASLSHPNIVQVYAFGDDDDAPFVAMEYIAGPGMSSSLELVWITPQAL